MTKIIVQNIIPKFFDKVRGNVHLFGHSQGGKLVSKINTLTTGITGVVANAPGPIQFDQTCAADPSNTSCSKVATIHGASSGDGSEPYQSIGLETYTSTHNAPIRFTQALDDPTGNTNQATWLQDYVTAVQAISANAAATVTTVLTGGHAAYESNTVLQNSIFNFINASTDDRPGDTIVLTPSNGITYTIDGVNYPIMGSLYVPSNLKVLDILVVFHGTLSESDDTKIADAANYQLNLWTNTFGVRDRIVFAVAYPQDHISQDRQYNLTGVGTEQADFLMGDNLPYARAAVEWAKNNLIEYLISRDGVNFKDVVSANHAKQWLDSHGIIKANKNTIDENVTIPADKSGFTAGTVKVSNDKTVTINGVWRIL